MPVFDVIGEWGAGALTLTATVNAADEAAAEAKFRELYEASPTDRLWVRARLASPSGAGSGARLASRRGLRST